jgi:hypothetical protein
VAEARPVRLLLEQGLARVRQSLVFTAQRPLRDKPLAVQVRGGLMTPQEDCRALQIDTCLATAAAPVCTPSPRHHHHYNQR